MFSLLHPFNKNRIETETIVWVCLSIQLDSPDWLISFACCENDWRSIWFAFNPAFSRIKFWWIELSEMRFHPHIWHSECVPQLLSIREINKHSKTRAIRRKQSRSDSQAMKLCESDSWQQQSRRNMSCELSLYQYNLNFGNRLAIISLWVESRKEPLVYLCAKYGGWKNALAEIVLKASLEGDRILIVSSLDWKLQIEGSDTFLHPPVAVVFHANHKSTVMFLVIVLHIFRCKKIYWSHKPVLQCIQVFSLVEFDVVDVFIPNAFFVVTFNAAYSI